MPNRLIVAGQRPKIPEFCRAIVDGYPMGVAFVSGTNHAIRYVNEPFCRLVGKTAEALSGELFANAVPAGEECLALLARVFKTGLAEIHTGQEDTAAALLYWSYVMWPVLSSAGVNVGIMIQVTETAEVHTQAMAMNQALMIGSVRQHELTEAAEAANDRLEVEIAQRKLVESELHHQQLELRASEGRYRGLIEAIPQIVWTASADGSLEFGNVKWLEYFGKDATEFNGPGWAAVVHPEDEERWLEEWLNGLRAGSPFQIEHRLKNFTGSYRWFLSRAVPIISDTGAVAKWFGTSTDVEDQKRAELASFNKQKLESLGLLAGGIAHDFNNLLCSILGNASVVAGSLPESHPMQGSLGDIVGASERAAHLTRQMLAYAGKGRFLIEQVDIPDLVRSTCALIRASIPRTVELVLKTSPDLPQVEADSGQMQQVIMNLVLNAAEAIEPSSAGLVVVKMDMEEMSAGRLEKAGPTIRHLRPGFYIVIEVTDDGSGMNAATQAKIFDPFFTTKFTGRGLGLAAVEGILRSQGGAIEVESILGKGTTFRVCLPVSPRAKCVVEPIQTPPRKTASDTVLVVDDDEMVRRVTKLSLENAGFHVRLAFSGEEALETLLSGAEPTVSLVVLDLSMQGMGGKQLMQQMKILGIKIPVLISSGYNEREVLEEFSGLSISGFVQKSFTPRQLADRVSKALYPERQPP